MVSLGTWLRSARRSCLPAAGSALQSTCSGSCRNRSWTARQTHSPRWCGASPGPSAPPSPGPGPSLPPPPPPPPPPPRGAWTSSCLQPGQAHGGAPRALALAAARPPALPLPLLLLLPPPPAPPRRPGEGPTAPHGAPFPHGLRAGPGTRAPPRQSRAARSQGRGEGGAGGASSAARPLAAAHRPAPSPGRGWQGRRRRLRAEGRAARAAWTNPDSGAPPRARTPPLGQEGVGKAISSARAPAPSPAGSAHICGAPSEPHELRSGGRGGRGPAGLPRAASPRRSGRAGVPGTVGSSDVPGMCRGSPGPQTQEVPGPGVKARGLY